MAFFLFLGMHRSGTSCLAGSFQQCSVHLGNVRRSGKYNKKGYFEISEVQKIHDQILGLNNSTWLNPPMGSVVVHAHHASLLKDKVRELQEKKDCGIKDPRTLLILDFWKEIIGSSVQLVGTFRHPKSVALSLSHRNGMSEKKGIELWKTYNQILVKEHQKSAFPIIHFDLSDVSTYRKNIISVAKQLDLKINNFQLRRFISSSLEHHQFKKEEMPEGCKDLYNYLNANAVKHG